MTDAEQPKRTRLLRQKVASQSQKKSRCFGFLSTQGKGKLDRTLEKEIANKREENVTPSTGLNARWRLRLIFQSRVFLYTIVTLCILECSLIMVGLILELTVVNHLGEDIVKLMTTSSRANNELAVDESLVRAGHGLTYASVAVVALLVAVTAVKIVCFGQLMLRRKFECFDVICVVASFVLDIVLLEKATEDYILENTRVISLLMPLKILRVVNSMIIALYDDEHNKLLVMFKSKTYLTKQRDQITQDIKRIEEVVTTFKIVTIHAGVPERAVTKVLGKILMESQDKKCKNALKTMVAMAMSGPGENAPPRKHKNSVQSFANMSKDPVSVKLAFRRYSAQITDEQAEATEAAVALDVMRRRHHSESIMEHENHTPEREGIPEAQVSNEEPKPIGSASPPRSTNVPEGSKDNPLSRGSTSDQESEKRPLIFLAGNNDHKRYVCIRSPFSSRGQTKYNVTK